MENLGELFMKARRYGLVYIHTSGDGTYHCSIKFNTIEHTSLEANSGFGNITPDIAIEKAILSADAIVRSVTDIGKKLQLPPADPFPRGTHNG